MACLFFTQFPAWSQGVSASAQAQAEPSELKLTAPPGSANFDTGSLQFIGSATVLIRYGGFTILTDPNFLHKDDRITLGFGVNAKRLIEPALTLENLPPIDLIVLSHLDDIHFDPLVQERMDHALPIVTTPQAAKALTDLKFQALYPLSTWQTLTVTKGGATLRITALPARHGPQLLGKRMPPTIGSMLEFGSAPERIDYRIYISGDTLMFDAIRAIPKRFPDIDLALLHLGGMRLMGTLISMDGKQGAEILRLIAPQKAIPIHVDDYDVFKSPLSDFDKQVKAAELQSKVIYLKQGESYNFHGKQR